MEHGRHQALVVHMHIREDMGHGNRVRDVGVAALPLLPLVSLVGELVGL